MDAVMLARVQFALTIGFHYLFPPLTIGMSWIILWMKLRHLRTGDVLYADMARFWTRIFALGFALGVATGITMEFQFGTNWAAYSRYVGDIFGAPLAAEGVFTFFLESTFLGLLLFGEKRISPRMHAVAAFMVALGATLSAFWIIVANSWQQTPRGFEVVDGRAVLTDFWAAVFTPSMLPRYTHAIGGALTTGALFVAGLSAYYLLKKRHLEFARRSLAIAMVTGLIGAWAQFFTGHAHAVQVSQNQPAKLAAYEGLFETQRRAPLLLFGMPNPETRETEFEIALPGMLSLLVGSDLDTEVLGLNDFPRELWPPVRPSFVSFHLMFVLGVAFIGMTSLGTLLLLWRRKLFDTESAPIRWFLRAVVLALPLPMLTNELGWFAAEVGRQPWVVYNVLRTADAVSITVPAEQIAASIVMFLVLYSLLFGLWIFLLGRKIRSGPVLTAAPSPATARAEGGEEVAS
jgi:cytochrome d ubiquinol oxidase subunit I